MVYKKIEEIESIEEVLVENLTCMDEGVVDCDFDKMDTIRFKINGVKWAFVRGDFYNNSNYKNFENLSLSKRLEIIRNLIYSCSQTFKWTKDLKKNKDFEKNPYYILYNKIKDLNMKEVAKVYKGLANQPIKIISDNSIEFNNNIYYKVKQSL